MNPSPEAREIMAERRHRFDAETTNTIANIVVGIVLGLVAVALMFVWWLYK